MHTLKKFEESKNKSSSTNFNPERRKFNKLALSGVLGGKILLSNTVKAYSRGNMWSATGLKLGISCTRTQ